MSIFFTKHLISRYNNKNLKLSNAFPPMHKFREKKIISSLSDFFFFFKLLEMTFNPLVLSCTVLARALHGSPPGLSADTTEGRRVDNVTFTASQLTCLIR